MTSKTFKKRIFGIIVCNDKDELTVKDNKKVFVKKKKKKESKYINEQFNKSFDKIMIGLSFDNKIYKINTNKIVYKQIYLFTNFNGRTVRLCFM